MVGRENQAVPGLIFDEYKKNLPDEVRTTLRNTIRVAVLGASRVGKTQIINRIVNNAFSPVYEQTEEKEEYKVLINLDQSSYKK